MLAPKKVTKEEGTPLPLISCTASQNLAAAELASAAPLNLKVSLRRYRLLLRAALVVTLPALKQSSLKTTNFAVLLGAAEGFENHAKFQHYRIKAMP